MKVYPYTDDAMMLGLRLDADVRSVLPMALDDANDIRRALAIGDGALEELPPGVISNSSDCVLARALSNGWRAVVGSEQAGLFHPVKGKSQDAIDASVTALEQMGFKAISFDRVDADCPCGDPNCSESGEPEWKITIPHTWAVMKFVSLFDNRAFPELILND